MTQVNSPEDSLIAVNAWLKAWDERDLEGMKAASTDDYIQWHATVRKNLTKDEEFAMLEDALKVMKIKFKDIELTPLSGGKVLQQCVADIEIEGAGSRSDVPFGMVYDTRGHKITRCDEYMDGMSLPPIEFTPKD